MQADQQKIILGEGIRVWAGRLDHHSTSGNARIPKNELNVCSYEVCPDKDLFFSSSTTSSQQESALTILCPVAAARCSFHLMSSYALMPASVSPSPSVNLQP
jgi:hypothetical protein